MRRMLCLQLFLMLAITLATQGCGGKKPGMTEAEAANERYGNLSRFTTLATPQTVQLKTLLITVPAGWKYDADVEERTVFNVKPVMFAFNEHLAKQAPPIFLEYMEGKRDNFPSQEELKKFSPADKEDIRSTFTKPMLFSSVKIHSVEFIEINGLYGVQVKSTVTARGHADKILYSVKFPIGDTLTSFLFAYYDYHESPALQREIQDIFHSIRPAKK